jgi:hypothetical protein
MTRPDFIVIGAMKCATSTVNAYLEDHADVFMPPGREPRFFAHDDRFAKGTDWYEAFFTGYSGQTLCGEGSNDYAAGAMYPETAARMAAYRPDLKLIYMVRHPLDRLASAWVQNRADMGDKIPPTLDRAVQEMPERYVDQSLYWKNLSRYRTHFPDEQIFIGFMEDLNADREAFFARLTAFLGVPPSSEIKRGHMNPSQGKRIPSPAYTAVNRMPFSGTLKRLVPKALKQTVKDRLLSRSADERPQVSPAVRALILPELRADAEPFLAHCGKPTTYWSLT